MLYATVDTTRPDCSGARDGGDGLERPDIVMRFGYGPTLPYSARRLAVLVA
jgi:hypothetical protein